MRLDVLVHKIYRLDWDLEINLIEQENFCDVLPHTFS